MFKFFACTRLKAALAGASLAAIGSAMAPAYAQEQTRNFDIPAQPLASALVEYSRQAGIVVVVPADLTEGKQAHEVRGALTTEAALAQLLAGSGLQPRRRPEGGLTLVFAEAPSPTQLGGPEEAAPSDQAASAEEIVVTGTHIRGVHPDSSALIVIGQEEIARSGAASVEQLLRQIPQNFAALDQETFIAGTGDEQVSANVARGATVDLRGLGIGATLILVNGHRVAPSGLFGAFVDVSAIPLSAIDRIEVLTDGASALYGADAVAGVVNFVLKRDFSGAETRVRYGRTGDTGLEEQKFSQALGRSWSGGNAMLVYEYFRNDELLTSDRDYIPDQGGKFALIPALDRHNVYSTFRQHLGTGLEISADAFWSDRLFEQDSTVFGSILNEESGGAEAYGGAVTISKELPMDWNVKFTGNYATTEEIRRFSFPPDPTVNFNRTNAEVIAGDVRADGLLWMISGGDVRASIGLETREERFGDNDGKFSRWTRSAYGELFVPLIGSNNPIPLVQRLELSLAGRYDDYEDVGSSFNPKAGVFWEPIAGLGLRGTYATSFRAPPLSQLRTDSNLFFVLPIEDPQGIPIITLVDASIGTPDLKPETSRSFTFGLDLTPDQLPGFKTTVTYFNIEFEDRIAQPPLISLFTIYSQLDVLAPFFDFSPDPTEVARIFAEENVLNFAGVGPSEVEVFFDGRLKNLARTKTSGLDFLINYERSLGQSELNLFGSATYLFERSDQAASTTPEIDVVNRIYNPPRFRGRAGGTWTRGSLSSTLTVNYTNAYQNDLVAPPDEISSWTTFDLQIAWRAADDEASFLRGLGFTLDVLNLTDERPPRVSGGNNINLGFDPTNASPRGRFIAAQITKRW